MITRRRTSMAAAVIGVVAVAGLVGVLSGRDRAPAAQVAPAAQATSQPMTSVPEAEAPLDCPSGFSNGTVLDHDLSAVPVPNPMSGEVAVATELITNVQRDLGESTSLSVREVSRQDRRAVYRFATSERDVAEATFDRIGPDRTGSVDPVHDGPMLHGPTVRRSHQLI